jgi:hypothetical protein
MDITAKDAFKLGFLTRCAQEKLTEPELDARLEKAAEISKSALLGFTASPVDITKNIAPAAETLMGAAKALLAVPPAAAIVGGGALGYGAAKMVEPEINDDEIRAQELADTYRLYAEKAKAHRKVRQYRLGHKES